MRPQRDGCQFVMTHPCRARGLVNSSRASSATLSEAPPRACHRRHILHQKLLFSNLWGGGAECHHHLHMRPDPSALQPTASPSQNVMDDFVCALKKRILLQGRMYVFEHYVCFHSNVLGYVKNKIIPLKVNTKPEIILSPFGKARVFCSSVTRCVIQMYTPGYWFGGLVPSGRRVLEVIQWADQKVRQEW